MRVTRRASSPPTSIHRLKISLKGVRPSIWRRIEVASDITLARLHDAIQDAMGWGDEHLHEFRIGSVKYGDPWQLQELGGTDERRVRLGQVAPRPKTRFRYLYDFGDSWEHEILVEAIKAPDPAVIYPICIDGRRACPPEDCGGVWGYGFLLDALANPDDPDGEARREWIGGPFDAEAFSLDEVNQRMR